MKIRDLFEGKEPKKIPPTKPRNFVAKNATTSGAGAHKNKKKAMKQGDVKHKGRVMAEDYNLGGLLPGKYYLHSIYMDSKIFTDPQSGKPMAFNSFDDAENFRGRMSGREYDEYQVSLFNNGKLQHVDEDIVEGSESTVATLDAVFNEQDFYRLENVWPALEEGDKEEALRQINHYLRKGKNRAWWGDLQAVDINIDANDIENSQVMWNKPIKQSVAEAEPVPGKYSGHFYDAEILPNGDYKIVKINSKKDNDGKTNPLNLEVGAVIPKGKAYSLQYTYDGGMFDELNRGMAKGSLNEFAPGKGSGKGRWYNDSDIAAIVGNGWYEEMDVSGDAPKQWMLQQAQDWLESQGYTVDVLDCKINDDDMDWYISGTFDRQGVAEKGI